MFTRGSHRAARRNALHQYGEQLSRLADRNGAGQALLSAMHAEAAATAAHAAMLEAKAADRAKTEFLAHMSHELRTPLNAIIGFSDMIRCGVVGPAGVAKFKEYADDINQSGHHLLQLINDILDLAKIEAGRLELDEEAFSLEAAIDTCTMVIEPIARSGQVTLARDSGTAAVAVYGDERKLRQILLNLLSNAVKFTPAGGQVRLTTRLDDAGGLHIQVSDTGIGIAPEDIWKALAPFRQVDSAFNRKHSGTGLGLPLTKGLVELHGGSLNIDSEINKGTVVTVALPANRISLQHAIPARDRAALVHRS